MSSRSPVLLNLVTAGTVAAIGLGFYLLFKRYMDAVEAKIDRLQWNRSDLTTLQTSVTVLEEEYSVASEESDFEAHEATALFQSFASFDEQYYDAISDDNGLSNDSMRGTYFEVCDVANLSPLFPVVLADGLEDKYKIEMKNLRRRENNASKRLKIAYLAYHLACNLEPLEPDRARDLYFEAKEHACSALELEPDNGFVHKWCAITAGATQQFTAQSGLMEFLKTFENYLNRAADLIPSDWFVHYMKGRLCYEIASLSSFKKNLLWLHNQSLATVTFDKALLEFQQAALYGPKVICLWVSTAETLLKMGNVADATALLRRCINAKPVFIGDQQFLDRLERIAADCCLQNCSTLEDEIDVQVSIDVAEGDVGDE